MEGVQRSVGLRQSSHNCSYESISGPSRRVEAYTKKNGELGYKIVGGDVIFEKQAFRYLQECKYGCGNYISFDNYKKRQKALHIDQDLNAIGRYCPKYEWLSWWEI